MKRLTAEDLITHLKLVPHPKEGGYFRETYRSRDTFHPEMLPKRYTTPHQAGTAIYYLFTPDSLSLIHRLNTDEIFHFYLGDPVELVELLPDGGAREVVLGQDILAGQRVQHVVEQGIWFGGKLCTGGSYALVGTTVAPGFEYSDYEHGIREDLMKQYPAEKERILELT